MEKKLMEKNCVTSQFYIELEFKQLKIFDVRCPFKNTSSEVWCSTEKQR